MAMSEAQKKAASARMKAFHAAKKQESLTETDEGVRPETTPQQEAQILPEDYQQLLKTVQELKARLDSQPQQAPLQAPQVSPQGQLVGTFEKYIVDPLRYPDPRERLASEPRLARFAFPINYELGWDVGVSSYETKQGVHTQEPKFSLELNYIIRDPETDEPTVGRYTLRKATFHEDPTAAMAVASESGLSVDSYGQKEFLDEMRYLRMRNWLLEAFYPPKTDVTKSKKKDMVFGNKVVQYFEVSSPNSVPMPFDQLNTKL